MATLLIVEDDKQTNEAICEYLKSAGHKIVPAFDGVEALKIFEQGNIDLVILDIERFYEKRSTNRNQCVGTTGLFM